MKFQSLWITILLSVALLSSSTYVRANVSLNETQKGNEILAYNSTEYANQYSANAKIPLVIIGDGKVSSIWDEVTQYPVSTFGETGGSFSSFHDNDFVYFLITQDVDIAWVAIQWDVTHIIDAEKWDSTDMEPMHNGDDLWVFGNTEKTGVYGDSNAHGQNDPFITHDTLDNLYWERIQINDTSGNLVKIGYEVMRTLNTQDIEGKDATFSHDQNITGLMASDVNHKIDNKVTQFKYVISSTNLGQGGQVLIGNQNTPQSSKNVAFYLFSQLSIGLFIGSLYFAIMVRLSIRYIARRK